MGHPMEDAVAADRALVMKVALAKSRDVLEIQDLAMREAREADRLVRVQRATGGALKAAQARANDAEARIKTMQGLIDQALAEAVHLRDLDEAETERDAMRAAVVEAALEKSRCPFCLSWRGSVTRTMPHALNCPLRALDESGK